ncbi:hypothetical protein C8J56DRAFT_1023711 [Mycena floridula]|nr:hypothetical protein C8J56DRAFT_1023711 [Mycena floridula]
MLQIFDKRQGKPSGSCTEPTSPQWLEYFLQVTTLLQDAGDLAPVPYVSASLSLVVNILKIIKTVKQNQDSFREIVTNIVGIVTMVRDEIISPKLQTDCATFLAHCKTFNESLIDIMKEINNQLRSLSGPKKYLLSSSIKEDIQKYQDRIHECRANFLLWIAMQNRLAVHQVHNSIHEMRNDISQLSRVMASIDEDGTSGTGHVAVAPSMSILPKEGKGLLAGEDDKQHLRIFHVVLPPSELSSPRGIAGACFRCMTLKVRCEFETDTDPCQRCLNCGHECFIPATKKHRASPNHKYLVEEEDEPIQELIPPAESSAKGKPEGSHPNSSASLLVKSEQEELIDVTQFCVPDLPVQGSQSRVPYVGSTRRSKAPSPEPRHTIAGVVFNRHYGAPNLPVEGTKARAGYVSSTERSNSLSPDPIDWHAIGVTNISTRHSEGSGSTTDFVSCLDSGEFRLSEWYNFDSSSSQGSHRFSPYSDRYGSSAGSPAPRSRISRSPSVFLQTSSAVSYRRSYSIHAPRYSPYSRSVSPLVPVSSHPSMIPNLTSWLGTSSPTLETSVDSSSSENDAHIPAHNQEKHSLRQNNFDMNVSNMSDLFYPPLWFNCDIMDIMTSPTDPLWQDMAAIPGLNLMAQFQNPGMWS